jgi:hypothetical protein
MHAEPPRATDSIEPRPITIVDATDAFIASCTNRGIAEPTLKKYRTFAKQLKAFCKSRGYVRLIQLTTGDMDRFYTSWKDGKRARAKKLERLKAFVKFCLKRKWLAEDIAEDLKAPEGSSLQPTKRRSPTKNWIASSRPAMPLVRPHLPDPAKGLFVDLRSSSAFRCR